MKKIVTIGGGTGSFTLLSGLKKYPVDISAIVTMADDGGSTGVLRDELGVLPPGDVRQCLVALSDSSDVLRRLMNYRFERGGLRGHSFGNLFLSALEKIEGDFSSGLEEAAKILNIKGSVIPVSGKKMNLEIRLNNDEILYGEYNLDSNKLLKRHGVKSVKLVPGVRASKKAIEAVSRADMIVVGPGDYYGSIVPNLLTKGLVDAIGKSKAKLLYICNLTNKKGQTDNFSLHDYAHAINHFFWKDRINYVLIPNSVPDEALVKKYEKQEGLGSVVDFGDIKRAQTYKIKKASILKKSKVKDRQKSSSSFIRHDSGGLAKAVMDILKLR